MNNSNRWIAVALVLAAALLSESPPSFGQEGESNVIRGCVDRRFGRLRLLGYGKSHHKENLQCRFYETEIGLVPAVEGKLGIGTADPEEALDVVGNIHSTGTIASGNSIEIDGTRDTITSTSGMISFDDTDLVTSGLVAAHDLCLSGDCREVWPPPVDLSGINGELMTLGDRVTVLESDASPTAGMVWLNHHSLIYNTTFGTIRYLETAVEPLDLVVSVAPFVPSFPVRDALTMMIPTLAPGLRITGVRVCFHPIGDQPTTEMAQIRVAQFNNSPPRRSYTSVLDEFVYGSSPPPGGFLDPASFGCIDTTDVACIDPGAGTLALIMFVRLGDADDRIGITAVGLHYDTTCTE